MTAALSAVGHAAVVFVLVSAQPQPEAVAELAPIVVQLIDPPPPPPPLPPPEPDEPAPAPPSKAPPKAEKPPPQVKVRKPRPAPPTVATLAVKPGPVTIPGNELSDDEVASAATSGSGSGSGRGCNMARLLEGKLRKDRQVQLAMADVSRGRAIRVWNGDWVRHGEQEGEGLAAVREAIMWEVAFAPAACRTEPVRGLVVISLAEGPGAPRVAVGAGAWRWSDLLFSRSSGGSGRRQQ